MTNTISGMAEALVNKRPMIVIAGAPDMVMEGTGSFQEFDQMACAKPVTKYAARANSITHIPLIVERAVKMAVYGTPGPVYIELTSDVLYGKIDEAKVTYLPKVSPLPSLILPDITVKLVIEKLKSAKQPLVIVGKGVAYSRAEEVMRSFIHKSNIPFLATPMGKGVLSDYDALSANSARTFVL
jgi:2-hydroxyacyl-CoA lyase 1